MKTIEAPSLEGYQPVRDFTVMDVGYVVLQSQDGVKITLSPEGVTLLDTQPDSAARLLEVGEFIAEHDGLKDVVAFKEAIPDIRVKVVACVGGGYNKNNGSSIYKMGSDTLIKAYDIERMGARLQFFTMAWLNTMLRTEAGAENVTSPKQYALFTSPRKHHRSAVMQYIDGQGLSRKMINEVWAKDGNNDEARATIRGIKNAVSAAVEAAVAPFATGVRKTLLNDIGQLGNHMDNLLVIGDEPLTDVDQVAEREIAIIDQPCATPRYAVIERVLLARSRLKF